MLLTAIGTILGLVAAAAALGVPFTWPLDLTLTSASPRWSLVTIASDLVQAYAILAGLIVQVITLVALVFDPKSIDPRRVKRIAASLDGMQQQLLGLFAVYVATLFCALGSKIAIDPAAPPHSPWWGLWIAATAFMVCFSVARTAEMSKSILAVQRLRSRLLLIQLKKLPSTQSQQAQPLPVEPDPTPEAYGTKVDRPSQ